MIYLSLTSIIVLFFLIALIINPALKKAFGFKLCAICSACSMTWITLLLLRQFEIVEIEDTLIGVFMGGSVAGIMFELQEYFKKQNIKSFWIIRLLEITSGFYLAYSVAIWDVNMILIGTFATIIVSIITIMLIRRKIKDIKQETKNKSKEEDSKGTKISEEERLDAIEKLEKSLDDCC
jgi:hypothetical protein